ncbi:MAG: hypothetical protein K0S07_973 [Chlamydiales bacterium]|jgi:hypothetical protein|nr:hypothetical protein [Chlamydiales bacterium]
MKEIFFQFLLAIMPFMACLPCQSEPVDKKLVWVGEVLRESTDLLEKKYNLRAVGSGIGMPGGNLFFLGLSFDVYRELEKEEIRALLVESTQDFLKIINSKEELKLCMSDVPFTVKNIQVNLFFSHKNGVTLNHPAFGRASIDEPGILSYETLDVDDFLRTVTDEEETFEDAIKALENPIPSVKNSRARIEALAKEQALRQNQVADVLRECISYLEKKYDLKSSETPILMPGGKLHVLDLNFNIYRKLEKEEIRLLMVDSVKIFLNHINEKKDLIPCLSDVPFTLKNIRLNFFFKDHNKNDLNYPAIGLAYIDGSNGLTYLTFGGRDSRLVKREEESFEEAIKALGK